MTQIAVAFLAGLFGLATIAFQAKVHRDNRTDHASTAEVVAAMRVELSDVRRTGLDTRADVRDIKADMRSFDERLDAVEDRRLHV